MRKLVFLLALLSSWDVRAWTVSEFSHPVVHVFNGSTNLATVRLLITHGAQSDYFVPAGQSAEIPIVDSSRILTSFVYNPTNYPFILYQGTILAATNWTDHEPWVVISNSDIQTRLEPTASNWLWFGFAVGFGWCMFGFTMRFVKRIGHGGGDT